MKTLVVLNDPAYGTERSYNGLRLAHALAKRDSEEVRVLGDAVSCGLTGQQTPNGYDNLERIVAGAIERGTKVGLCGTCMDARAIREEHPIEGARRSNLEELTDWTVWSRQGRNLVVRRRRRRLPDSYSPV